MELTVQPVLCDMLWIRGLPGTTVVLVLNGGLYIQTTANPEYPFLIYIQIVVMSQIVLDPAVAFVWILCMYLFHKLCEFLVFNLSGTLLAAEPTIVTCSGHSQDSTRQFYRVAIRFLVLFNCQINMRLPYLAQPRLLSISSNFFSR